MGGNYMYLLKYELQTQLCNLLVAIILTVVFLLLVFDTKYD